MNDNKQQKKAPLIAKLNKGQIAELRKTLLRLFSSIVNNKKDRGFTLVELAIVIIIIGLLTAGVLVGQTLIQTSKVNKEVADLNSFYSAHITFKNKYNCLPADCPRASSFLDNTLCASMVYGGLGCNGDGNLKYNIWSGTDYRSDPHRYWIHLELAKMLKGASKTNNESSYNPSNFSPFASHYVTHGESTIINTGLYYNFIVFAGVKASSCNNCSILTPEQAYTIDKKLDDALPNSGRVITFQGGLSSGTCMSSSSYNLSDDRISCILTISLE